ncbi:MAG: hypothetical protein H0X36_13305 [Sphingomonadaceae bacterium]|nr:hypothetical protein [Sphingomonadaceae bacterium]
MQAIFEAAPVAQLPWSFELKWNDNGQQMAFSGLWPTSGADSRYLYIQRDDDGSSSGGWQVLEVVTEPRRKRRFKCPVTGKLSARLLYRDGRFASAAAQNLKPQSQRSASFSPRSARNPRRAAPNQGFDNLFSFFQHKLAETGGLRRSARACVLGALRGASLAPCPTPA